MPPPAFLYDDAYITLHSAAVLWSGSDPHYPGAAALYGITSPFSLLIVAGLVRVMAPEWALLTSCLLGTAVYSAGLAALGRAEGLSRTLTGAVVLVGLGTGVSLHHQVNGLETSWAMASVCWSLVLVKQNRQASLAALCGLLPFVRPELALWSVALLAWIAVRRPGYAGTAVLVAMAAAAPWVLWLWSSTGHIVPTSLAAKRDWYAETCWPAARRVSVVGSGVVLWVAFSAGAIAGLAGLCRTGVGRLALATMGVILVMWTASVPSLLYSYQHHRYFSPMLVLLAYGMCLLPQRFRGPLVAAGALAALVTSVTTARLAPGMLSSIGLARRQTVAHLQSMGATRVLLHDAGYLAWANAAPTLIDMVGLKSPEAAAINARVTGPSCGAHRGEALDELARRTGPDTLVVWEPWDQLFGVTAALRSRGWRVEAQTLVGTEAPIAIYRVRPPDVAARLSPAR